MKQSKVAEIEVSYKPAIIKKPIITCSLDAFKELIEFFPQNSISLYERFVALYMNQSNRVIGVYELSKGGITGTVVDVRLLLAVALKIAATGIILCHNHPSGNLKPSSNDIVISKKIKEACKLFDIRVYDHLIITSERKYYSMADEGVI